MLVTGKLRRSIRARVDGDKIVFTSDMPYAAIHNEGGTIQMKPRKQIIHFNKKGKFSKKKKAHYAQKASRGAYTLTIPQRQFIGNAPEVKQAVERVVKENMKDLEKVIANALNPRK
jgi:phage gpG-like protein